MEFEWIVLVMCSFYAGYYGHVHVVRETPQKYYKILPLFDMTNGQKTVI